MNATQIKQLRERLDLSQEALARRVGVSTRTIQRAEKGKRLHPFIMEKLEQLWNSLKEAKA